MGNSKKNQLLFIFNNKQVCLFSLFVLTILNWHVKHHKYNIQIHQFFKTKQQNKKRNHIKTCNIRVLDSKYISMSIFVHLM